MNHFFDVFISYGRADSLDFATKLYQRLTERGLRVWFDKKNIPFGVDYQREIDEYGIEKAHNFLFIIGPHSLKSVYCRKEIDLAVKLKKRIIPLVHIKSDEYLSQTHPIIGKLNWIWFQEEINDFEESFANSIHVIQKQADYVELHTQILAKALEWERHEKQTKYLLIGEERKQAEAWLKIRFKTEQAPCSPTDLHCEFITESIKNANNLMTQVFLSYAEQDELVMEQIRNSLRRESFTVWTNETDIQMGEAFQEAVYRGIEEADNVVYLLSPESLQSEFCQQELEYALSVNKRIIPILVRETDFSQVPPALRDLQYIDLTDNVLEDDYLLDESQLLRILRQDATYYNEHKILLAKALKWQRQHCNPSILLRGYNLRHAEAWLKVAKQRGQHLPTSLQEEFIAESLRQPQGVPLDVFVSYSRTDSDFARKLNDALQMQGKTTWFDQESIASGVDFQQEIYRGIECSDNFLFILSPASVNSPYCAGEVEHAAKLNKRFVTVLHQQVNPTSLHPELAKVQWIDFNQQEGDFFANFNQLVRTLDTDREHLRNHTKWSQRAIEWQEKDKSADLLLRGSEFALAENWLKVAEEHEKQPAPTPLQKDYITASREAIATARKKEKRQVTILWSLLGVMSVALVAVAGLGWLAYQREQEAEQLLEGQVNALSRYSESLSSSNQKFDALIEGMRASKPLLEQINPNSQSKHRAEEALRRALLGVKELNRIEGQTSVSVSPNQQTIATITKDGKVRLWDFQGKERTPLSHDGEKITEISFTQDGSKIATVSGVGEKRTIKLWDNQGKLIQSFAPIDKFDVMNLSPNGKLIVTYSWKEDKLTVKLWKIEGEQLKPLLPNEKFNRVYFNKDGSTIVTVTEVGDKRTIKFWDNQGQQIKSFDPIDKFNYLDFSPNGKLIVTSSLERGEQTVKLWKLEGQQLKTLIEEKFNSINFRKDGNQIATISNNNIIKLWTQEGKEPQTLHPGTGVERVYFSSEGKTLATVSSDKTVKFWNIDSSDRKVLKGRDAQFIDDGRLIATVHGAKGGNQSVKFWSAEGKQLQSLSFAQKFNDISFSNDGKLIATYSNTGDKRAGKLWRFEGKQLQLLLPNKTFNQVSFSDNSKLIATYSGEGDKQTGKLWRFEGKQPQPLLPNEVFNQVNFSDDGKLMATYSGEGDKQTGKLWRFEDKQPQPLLPNEVFNQVNFSKDGKLIATYSGEGDKRTAKLWRFEGKQPQLLLPNEVFNQVNFSKDGKLIATFSKSSDNQKINRRSSDNQTVQLWTRDEKGLASFPPDEKIDNLQFSPDGKLIATFNSNDETVKFWTLAEDKLKPLQEKVRFDIFSYESVVFSPDNKLIATINNNRVIQLWNRDGRELANLDFNEPIQQMSFSPNSKILAIRSQNKAPILWYLKRDEWERQSKAELKELVNQACKKVGNYLKNNASQSDRTLCNDIGKK